MPLLGGARRRNLSALVVAATLAVTGLTATSHASRSPGSSAAAPEAGREQVIVLLEGRPALQQVGRSADPGALSTARARVRDRQRTVLDLARSRGLDVREEHAYTDLVDGLAVTVAAGRSEDLRSLPGVVAVHPDRPMRASTDVSVPLVGAPEVWERADAQGRPVRGEGVTVAVLDTGVDYGLPSLGGGFGPGHRVVGGYDFANDDADPMDDNGHGTHVTGIVAGSGPVTGVAPAAEMTSYKVLDGDGAGYESDIIAGLEAAVAPDNPHSAGVVNMSLGGAGDGTGPIDLAATAATRQGVVVVAAAGNSGPAAGTVGSPAVAEGVVSVGASASGVRLPVAFVESPRHQKLQSYRAPYSANPPAEPVTGELVDVGAGTAADYDRVGDVTGKVVGVQSVIPGGIEQVSAYYLDQARRAEERGAIALLGYRRSAGGPVLAGPDAEPGRRTDKSADSSPSDGLADVPLRTAGSGDSFRMDSIVVLGVDALQWNELAGFLETGPVRISVAGDDITDRVASFSSQGPGPRFTMEPDLVAPGVEIRSTWPSRQWAPGEFRLSGTSMASPHVAGAAALLRQLRPDDGADAVAAALIGSAKGLEDVGPSAQGAGRLDVDAAAASVVTASPSSVSLGLADLARQEVGGAGSVMLRNRTAAPVQVALSGRPADGSTHGVTVTPASATIPANGTVQVHVRVSGAAPPADGELGGWVVADVTGGPDVRVPYLLSVRHLVVQASPDPTAGGTEAFVYSPTALAGPPVVTVTSPRGRVTTVPSTLDHGTWYRARITSGETGFHRVSAAAWTTLGNRKLVGSGSFEVLARDNRPGGDRWAPVGPNGEAGQLSRTPADPDTAAVVQYTKLAPWLTGDGGRRWRQADRLPVAGGSGTVVVDADDADHLWYAVNGTVGSFFQELLDPTYQGKVLESDDGGRSWSVLDFPDSHIFAFFGDPDTRLLAAVVADAVVLSTDGGRTWSSHASPVPGEEVLDAAMSGDDLVLGTAHGVWAVRGALDGVPDATEQVYDAGEVMLRGVVADDELIGVLHQDNRFVGSFDGGGTWATLHEFPRYGPWKILMREGVIMVGTYQQANHISRDHGRTWTEVPRPLRGPVEVDFSPWSDDSLVFASERAGLFRTGATGSDPVRIGVQGVTAYDLAVTSRGGGGLVAGTDADVYATDLPTEDRLPASVVEWGLSGYEGYQGTTVRHVETAPDDPSEVWKIRQDAVSSFWVYRSPDGGATWDVRGRDSEDPYDLVISPADPDRVVIPFGSWDGFGLLVTRDAGETWKKLFHDEVFTAVEPDPTDPDRLWLGSASGLYRSDDFGESVTKVASGRVTAISVHGDRVVAGGQRILVSRDGGTTFREADAGGPLWTSDLVAKPRQASTMYAATSSYTANGLVKGGRGVLRSRDGGRTWENLSGGLQNRSVLSLTTSRDGRWLYAGTAQGGVHRLRIR